MVSANLYIGNNLSLENFNKYLQREFTEKGITVTDKLYLRRTSEYHSLLVSIICEENLGETVDRALSNASNKLKEKSWRRNIRKQIYDGSSNFIIIGEYQNDTRASELFLTIAKNELERSIKLQLHDQQDIERRTRSLR